MINALLQQLKLPADAIEESEQLQVLMHRLCIVQQRLPAAEYDVVHVSALGPASPAGALQTWVIQSLALATWTADGKRSCGRCASACSGRL